MEILRLIYSFVPLDMKAKLLLLSFAFLIGMILDLLSIGMILPFIYFITDFKSVTSNEYLRPVYMFLGEPSQSSMIIISSFIFIFLFFVKNLFLAVLAFYKENFTFTLRARVAKRLFKKYLLANLDFHSNRNTSFLQRNIIQLSQELARSTQTLLMALMHLVTIAGVMIFLIYIESLGVILIGLFLGFFGFIMFFFLDSLISILSKRRYEYAQTYIQIVQESLGMIKEMRALRKANYFLDIFSNINNSYAKVTARENALGQIPRLWMEFGMVFSIMMFVIFVSFNNSNFSNLLPTIAIITVSGLRLIPALSAILGTRNALKLQDSSLRALYFEMNRKFKTNSSIHNHNLSFENSFSFNSVSYKYTPEAEYVFKNLNIDFKKGQKIGIIGESGSGKTTFLNLLLGLIEPIEGTIEIDGLKINKDDNLLNRIKFAIVPQDIFLIDSSIKENISLEDNDENIDLAHLDDVIYKSNLSEFVSSLPDGLDSLTGERGSIISGGERQRLGLARALYSRPQILILDEATSSLDKKNKSMIMNTVYNLDNVTTIIVTHEEETLSKCDKIFKVSDMKLEEVKT